MHLEPEIRLASVPREGAHANEDLTVVFGNFAWVLDGASDPLDHSEGCTHNASWYTSALSGELIAALEQQPKEHLRGLLATAIGSTRKGHEKVCGQGVHLQPSAALALVRWSSDHLEYLVLGDCTILYEDHDGVVSITDARLENVATRVRAEILERLRLGYGFTDPERPTLLSQLVEAEQRARNTDGGYWITAYDPDAVDHAVTGHLPLHRSESGRTTVALLSDGLDRAISLFHLHASYELFLSQLREAGPGSCARAVRAAERADPLGRGYPRTKSSDDASAIVLTWE
jgi:hypothetical protein